MLSEMTCHAVFSCSGLVPLSISGLQMSDCGRKSLCVQRYTFQHLLAIDPHNMHKCPTIRAFKFPAACVCHIELPEHSYF